MNVRPGIDPLRLDDERAFRAEVDDLSILASVLEMFSERTVWRRSRNEVQGSLGSFGNVVV